MSIMRISDEKAVAEYSNSIVDIANMSWNHLVTGYAYAQDDQLMRVTVSYCKIAQQIQQWQPQI